MDFMAICSKMESPSSHFCDSDGRWAEKREVCSSLLNRGTEKCAGVLFPTFCALGEGAARGNGVWAGSREGLAD